MKKYETVHEKSVEWKITTRHIQNLCKNGKIAGAIKKAGVWWIPVDAENPARRKRLDANVFGFSDTKREIFRKSMILFIDKGYENVSMRAIAGAVGIKQAAIYNHFGSKQEILDTIYDFFSHFNSLDRPSLDDIRPILKTGSLMDILLSVWYEYKADYRIELQNAIKIILQRTGIDKRAKEIAKHVLVDEGNKFAKEIFDLTVEIGRLAPFDTYAMGVFVNAVRMYVLQNWMIDSSLAYYLKVSGDERMLYGHAIKLLTDLGPFAEDNSE